jgi:hypothetical protein
MAKASRSKGSQGTSPQEAPKPETVTLKITVTKEIARLLKVEALGRGCSYGDLVTEWSRSVPRRFILTERGRGVDRTSDPSAPATGSPQSPAGAPHTLGLVSREAV